MKKIDIKGKIKKSKELVCILHKKQLITEAYIIGSIARGSARQESDIDLVLINPEFEFPLLSLNPNYDIGEIGKVVDLLKNTGVEFRLFERDNKEYKEKVWYQIYKDELFHIHIALMIDIEKEISLKITKDLC